MNGAALPNCAGASPVNAIAFAATPGSANHGQEPRDDRRVEREAGAERLVKQLRANEGQMKRITYGNYGVCLACYNLAHITKHHVRPRSVHHAREWKESFTVHLCRKCHAKVHDIADNATLAEQHQTLENVILAIRSARGISVGWGGEENVESKSGAGSQSDKALGSMGAGKPINEGA